MDEQFIKQSRLEDQAHYLLKERGVKLESIAEIVYDLQKDYIDDLTLDYCLEKFKSIKKEDLEIEEAEKRLNNNKYISEVVEQSEEPDPVEQVHEEIEQLLKRVYKKN